MTIDFTKIIFFAFLGLGYLLYASPASANVTEIQPLRFGEWVVTSNDTAQRVTINTDGSYDNSTGLIMLEAPQQGVYRIDSLPPSAIITSIDITMTDPMEGPGGNAFTMDTFQTSADPVDVNGETTLTLGATARTSGDGQSYDDGIYDGELTIDINL